MSEHLERACELWKQHVDSIDADSERIARERAQAENAAEVALINSQYILDAVNNDEG